MFSLFPQVDASGVIKKGKKCIVMEDTKTSRKEDAKSMSEEISAVRGEIKAVLNQAVSVSVDTCRHVLDCWIAMHAVKVNPVFYYMPWESPATSFPFAVSIASCRAARCTRSMAIDALCQVNLPAISTCCCLG